MIVKTTTRRDGAISSSYTERVSQNLDKAQPNERGWGCLFVRELQCEVKKKSWGRSSQWKRYYVYLLPWFVCLQESITRIRELLGRAYIARTKPRLLGEQYPKNQLRNKQIKIFFIPIRTDILHRKHLIYTSTVQS
jgi:hypothetical protein